MPDYLHHPVSANRAFPARRPIGRFCGHFRRLNSRILVSVGVRAFWWRLLAPCLCIQKFRSRKPWLSVKSDRTTSKLAAAGGKSPIVSGGYLKYSRFWETATGDRGSIGTAWRGRRMEVSRIYKISDMDHSAVRGISRRCRSPSVHEILWIEHRAVIKALDVSALISRRITPSQCASQKPRSIVPSSGVFCRGN